MARRKTKRRRRAKSFSVLNALEAYAYATIMTEGVAGTSPWGFVTGATDIGTVTTRTGLGMGEYGRGSQQLSTVNVGTGEISLGDLAQEPALALSTMSANFQSNIIPMALSAFGVRIGFKVGKRLLRAPIASVNRSIIKPALGAGIRL